MTMTHYNWRIKQKEIMVKIPRCIRRKLVPSYIRKWEKENHK